MRGRDLYQIAAQDAKRLPDVATSANLECESMPVIPEIVEGGFSLPEDQAGIFTEGYEYH